MLSEPTDMCLYRFLQTAYVGACLQVCHVHMIPAATSSTSESHTTESHKTQSPITGSYQNTLPLEATASNPRILIPARFNPVDSNSYHLQSCLLAFSLLCSLLQHCQGLILAAQALFFFRTSLCIFSISWGKIFTWRWLCTNSYSPKSYISLSADSSNMVESRPGTDSGKESDSNQLDILSTNAKQRAMSTLKDCLQKVESLVPELLLEVHKSNYFNSKIWHSKERAKKAN